MCSEINRQSVVEETSLLTDIFRNKNKPSPKPVTPPLISKCSYTCHIHCSTGYLFKSWMFAQIKKGMGKNAEVSQHKMCIKISSPSFHHLIFLHNWRPLLTDSNLEASRQNRLVREYWRTRPARPLSGLTNKDKKENPTLWPTSKSS